MFFSRHYTAPGFDLYKDISYESRVSRVTDASGKVLRESQAFHVPVFWSQMASDMLIGKFARRAGVPAATQRVHEEGVPEWLQRSVAFGTQTGGEIHAAEVFRRLAGCWTYHGWKAGYFRAPKGSDVKHGAGAAIHMPYESARAFFDELCYMLAYQIAAPNSPQWFNTGLHWAYGIAGEPCGTWRCDPESGVPAQCQDSYLHPVASACFIQSVEDSLLGPSGIMDLWEREARVFKMGSGSGVNFSRLRGKGERLTGGGSSSGLLSWLGIGDRSAGAIKSGGTTRRAARMVILDDDHPDLLEFVNWKVLEEQKVAAMVAGSALLQERITDLYRRLGRLKATGAIGWENSTITRGSLLPAPLKDMVIRAVAEGLDCPQTEQHTYDFEGAAYQTISGQNANNSVRVQDSFMESVLSGGQWHLKPRLQNSGAIQEQSIPASKIFDSICEAAWRCADPGLHFRDCVNDWNTCPNDAEIRASNPCGEFLWHDGSSCNLASSRLTAFLAADDDPDGSFDTTLFRHVVRLWTTVLDISVGMAAFPSRETAEGAWKHRTLGLGYSDLGALLMRLAVPYGSPEGQALAGVITALMHFTAWETSAEMAADLGAFPRYEANSGAVVNVLFNHGCLLAGSQAQLAQSPPPLKRSLVPAYLLRAADAAYHSAFSLTSQHGVRNAQLTLLAPCGTIGLVMDCDTTGVEPDFSLVKYKTLAGGGMLRIANQSVEPALERLGYKQDVIGSLMAHVRETGSLPAGFPPEDRAVFATAGELDWRQHLGMMAAVQPFLSGGISKTVNMPRSATVEDVRSLLIQAWHYRLKDVALYKDQSKLSQPLSSENPESKEPEASGLLVPEAPEILAPPIQTALERQDVPSQASRRPLPDRRRGYTQKIRVGGAQSLYLRTGEYPDGRLGEIFIDLAKQGSTMRNICSCFAISVSLGLQHGVPLEEYVDAYVGCKFEPDGIVQGHEQIRMAASIFDAVFRDLAINYLGRTDLANCRGQELAEQWAPSDDEGDVYKGNGHTDAGGLQMLQEGIKEERKETGRLARPSTIIASPDGLPGAGSKRPETMLANKVDVARSMGYSGDACRECGSFRMTKTGACLRCDNCGASSGCS